jgi:hypothetical protein
VTIHVAWGRQCWHLVPASCNYVDKYGMIELQSISAHTAVHPSSPGSNRHLRPLDCPSAASSTIHKPLLPLQIFLNNYK